MCCSLWTEALFSSSETELGTGRKDLEGLVNWADQASFMYSNTKAPKSPHEKWWQSRMSLHRKRDSECPGYSSVAASVEESMINDVRCPLRTRIITLSSCNGLRWSNSVSLFFFQINYTVYHSKIVYMAISVCNKVNEFMFFEHCCKILVKNWTNLRAFVWITNRSVLFFALKVNLV